MNRFLRLFLYDCILIAMIWPAVVQAGSAMFPSDFDLPAVTYGGAGGGETRADATHLARYPIVLVPDQLRSHLDWQGTNTGKSVGQGNVYEALLKAGFHPAGIWMIDLAPAGHHMSSIEEATDDLKLFIAAVMCYTGANKVHVVAHGAGGILVRLTLLKYSIAHWVASEVYIGTRFRGRVGTAGLDRTLAGDPCAWALEAGSDLLHEIQIYGDRPLYLDPMHGTAFRVPTLTIGSSDSVRLRGARNRVYAELDHDALRCDVAPVAEYVAFLVQHSGTSCRTEDRDGDGAGDAWLGGSDMDDGDPCIYPGAAELPGDGIDQDCNGCDLAEHGGRDIEKPLPPVAARAGALPGRASRWTTRLCWTCLVACFLWTCQRRRDGATEAGLTGPDDCDSV